MKTGILIVSLLFFLVMLACIQHMRVVARAKARDIRIAQLEAIMLDLRTNYTFTPGRRGSFQGDSSIYQLQMVTDSELTDLVRERLQTNHFAYTNLADGGMDWNNYTEQPSWFHRALVALGLDSY
jgi:hypothetical protein